MKIKTTFIAIIILICAIFINSKIALAADCGGKDPDICECLGKSFGASCTVQSGSACNKGGSGWSPVVKPGDQGVCRRGGLGSTHESLCCGTPDPDTVCAGKSQCDSCHMNSGIIETDGFCMRDGNYLSCTQLPKGAKCDGGGEGGSSCSKYTSEDPCDNDDNCIWENGKCVKDGEETKSCSSYSKEDDCDNDDNCIWENGKCVKDGDGGGGGKPTSSTGSASFNNPLKYKTVEEFATGLLGTLRTIIVVLSIIFIVLGGIFYIISAGNDTMMKTAKGAITASMIGLAVGIAAPSFLKEIYTILGGQSGSGITPPSGLSLSQIALNFLNFLLGIVGILALIMLIIGGITFLTSAGDDDRYKTGKKIVTYAIIGIAVSLAALVIVKQIAGLLK